MNSHKKKDQKRYNPEQHQKQKAKRARTTKPRTIYDMLRQHSSRRDDDDDDDTEEACHAGDCVIATGENSVIVWVSCEDCENWFHSVCVGLGDRTEEELNTIDCICDDCCT